MCARSSSVNVPSRVRHLEQERARRHVQAPGRLVRHARRQAAARRGD
jgi:hypothetical protein